MSDEQAGTVDAKMLNDWRTNYNLVGRTPAEAMRWWHDHMNGKAPAGAVAALGLCINEIERLTAALQWEQSRAERQGTHADGCADWGPAHYECAIRERDDLRRQLAEAERDAKHETLSGDERWRVSAIEPLIVLRRIDAAKLGAVADADQQGKLTIKTRLRAIADCIHALHRAHSAQPVQAMGTGATGNATNAEQGSTAHAGERPAN